MPTDEEQAPESFEEAYRFWTYELRKAEMRGVAEEGMLLGLTEAIVIVIQSRFDTVPPDITKKLLETRAEVIQEVLAHVATDSLEQVRARLGVCCARPSLAGERAGVTFGGDRSWRGIPHLSGCYGEGRNVAGERPALTPCGNHAAHVVMRRERQAVRSKIGGDA